MRRASVALFGALVLTACPAPRRVSGIVYGAGTTTATGSRALKSPLPGATVTWTCPAGTGPQPQTLTTDSGGHFKSKDFYTDLPNDCELVVTKPGHVEFRERVANLCGEPQSWGCRDLHVGIELRGATAIAPATTVPTAVPLDLPRPDAGSASSDIQTVLSVVLAADGKTQVDGKDVADDEAIFPLAKAAREKNPELRAVIKADSSVPHGRVIHVLDLLKQAQVSKIAFGVTPM